MVEQPDGARAVVVLVDGDVEVEVGRIADPRPTLELVDALARLHLAAKRHGRLIRLHGTSPSLRALLDLVGLADELVAD